MSKPAITAFSVWTGWKIVRAVDYSLVAHDRYGEFDFAGCTAK
jgi:hypothetical protein